MKIAKNVLYRCKTREDLESFLLQCRELGVTTIAGTDIYQSAIDNWLIGRGEYLCFKLNKSNRLIWDYYREFFDNSDIFFTYYIAENKDPTITDIQNKLSNLSSQLFDIMVQLEVYNQLEKENKYGK